jgi:hypothetical protein
MKNKTIEWIATLRDEMTTKFNVISNNLAGRTKQLGSFISRNWLSVGASIAGAFYLAVQALEKVEKIAKKVSKSLKDATGGKEAEEAVKQIQLLSSYLEKTRSLVDEIIIRGGLMAMGVGKSIATFFATLYTIILTPLAKVEEALNFIGVTNSRTLQQLRDSGVKLMVEYSGQATAAFTAAFQSSEKLGLKNEEVVQQQSRAINKLATEDLPKLGSAYINEFGKIQKIMVDHRSAMDAIVEDMRKKNEEQASTYAETIGNIVNSMAAGMHAAFAGETGAGKTFLKSLLISFIDMVQGMIIAAKAAAFAKSILSFGATLIADLPTLLLATVSLQVARAVVTKLHTGGSYTNLGPDERQVIVRRDETLRVTTPAQEARGGSGNTFIFNFYTPVPHGRWVIDSAKEELRKTGLTIDKLIVNDRYKVTLP